MFDCFRTNVFPSVHVTFDVDTPSEICFKGGRKYAIEDTAIGDVDDLISEHVLSSHAWSNITSNNGFRCNISWYWQVETQIIVKLVKLKETKLNSGSWLIKYVRIKFKASFRYERET